MSRYLTKLPRFLKPYFIELLDTLWYMIKGLITFIISLLPKQQLIYSWRFNRVIPNIRKYFLTILLVYFMLHVGFSKVRAGEKFIMPKIEMTEEEKQHDNALYNKVIKNANVEISQNIYTEKQIKEIIDTDKLDSLMKKIDDLNNKQTYELSRTITPKDSANQNCYVSVKITQEGNNVIKKEILECADGRKGLITPSYWEIFAQFYYRDVWAPEYCRYYSRPDHVFKSFGKTCLNKNGEWRIVQ